MTRNKKTTTPSLFPQRNEADYAKLRYALVLNHWLLSLLGCKDMEAIAEYLRDERYEGTDEEGVSLFARELITHLFTGTLSPEDFLRYDANIMRHTRAINERRSQKIVWKYFQYLGLLFTEIYLDRYFSSREKLLDDLNGYLAEEFNNRPDTWHAMPPFTPDDLHKVALWNATGSGKTLLMHVNILQYQYYAKRAGEKWNRILLVTPNESLSKQHLAELAQSNISAQNFQKNGGGFFNGDTVEAIEITKLSDTMGDKTVAVGSFETNNLVLVDEGHKGSSGDVWKKMRDKLSENGFSFEYSATFGQSVGKDKALLAEYGKATLMDYSYKWFYGDGYGKDYKILNLNDGWLDNTLQLYLTACLMGFYEQLVVFETEREPLRPFLIEKPLAIFVGSSVTAVRKENKREVSDVVTILRFFSQFVANPDESRENIARLLVGSDGLIDKNNVPIFRNSFKYLHKQGLSSEAIFTDMLRRIFGSNVAGATLHLDNLKGADGEIGMRMGNADYFGVINVGDDANLLKLCAAAGIQTADRDFVGQSLFTTISDADSTINVLIGSKKFTEGWNSWRVSTMGLMNIGRSEGSEIIQLFGRGVRLKGYNMSLKRSSALASLDRDKLPTYISLLETLNIFGIRADYMEQFKAFLEEEGLPSNDSDYEEVDIPILPVVNLSGKMLKILRVKEGKDFKKDVVVDIMPNSQSNFPLAQQEITLDYYPKIQILRSGRSAANTLATSLDEGKLTEQMLAWVDWKQVAFGVQEMKNDRGWWNMNIDRSRLRDIMADSSWYRLYIPKEDIAAGDYAFSQSLWQTLATQLLCLYIDRTYNKYKNAWTSENMETAYLDKENPNFEDMYRIVAHKDLENILTNLKTLKQQIEDKSFAADFTIAQDFEAIYFSNHLYQPLLYMGKDAYTNNDGVQLVEVRPVPLNKGERDLVEDIKAYYTSHADDFKEKQLFLLRNKSRAGIGFFEANNFYPDFILWLVDGGHQYIAFIDPKGIRNLAGMDDPKIRLATVIHEVIEPRLNDPDITLNSFIVSNTPLDKVAWWYTGGTMRDNIKAMQEFNDNHVFFQSEQKSNYVKHILENMTNHQKKAVR